MISILKVNFVTLMETCTGSAGIRALLDLLNYNDCQAAPAQFKALSEAVEVLYIIWESIKNLVLDSSLESAPRLAAVLQLIELRFVFTSLISQRYLLCPAGRA